MEVTRVTVTDNENGGNNHKLRNTSAFQKLGNSPHLAARDTMRLDCHDCICGTTAA